MTLWQIHDIKTCDSRNLPTRISGKRLETQTGRYLKTDLVEFHSPFTFTIHLDLLKCVTRLDKPQVGQPMCELIFQYSVPLF